MDGLFHRRSHGKRIASRAQVNGGVVRGAVGLVNRQIDDRLGRRGEQAVFGVACDPNDGVTRTVLHLLADGVLTRPIAIDKGLVDDGNGLRVPRIRFGEFAARNHRGAESAKVIRPDDRPADLHPLVRLRHVALDLRIDRSGC